MFTLEMIGDAQTGWVKLELIVLPLPSMSGLVQLMYFYIPVYQSELDTQSRLNLNWGNNIPKFVIPVDYIPDIFLYIKHS